MFSGPPVLFIEYSRPFDIRIHMGGMHEEWVKGKRLGHAQFWSGRDLVVELFSACLLKNFWLLFTVEVDGLYTDNEIVVDILLLMEKRINKMLGLIKIVVGLLLVKKVGW